MKKFAFAALAAFIAIAPAQATSFYGSNRHHDRGHENNHDGHGCGQGEQGCISPLTGANTYTGDGGDIRDLKTFTSSINVTDDFTIADVNVSLNDLQHSFWADLEISLTHNGVTIWLSQDQGSSNNATGNYVFDDAGLNMIGASHYTPGTYDPLNPLSAFNGLNSAGLWTLKIYDDTWADIGDLCDWTLQLTPTPTSEVPEPATWAMMIAGFGLIGFQMRRRRTVAAIA